MNDGVLRFVDTPEWKAFVADTECREGAEGLLHELEFSDAEDLFGILESEGPAQERACAMMTLSSLFLDVEASLTTPGRARLVKFLEGTRRNESVDQKIRAMALTVLMRARLQEVARERAGKKD